MQTPRGCVPVLGRKVSGGECAAAGDIVFRLLAGHRAGTRARRECRSVVCGGLAGRGPAGHLRLGTCNEYRHQVDEAWHGLGGALRGRSPRTREGRIGPTAQNCSGQWSVVREGAYSDAELISRWLGLRSDLRHGEVRTRFGMHPCKPPRGDSARLLPFRYNGGSPPA